MTVNLKTKTPIGQLPAGVLPETLFQAFPQAALLTHPETGEIICANSAACKLFGFNGQSCVETNFKNLHANPASARHFSHSLRYALQEKNFLFIPEVKLKRMDGVCFPAQLDLSPVHNAEGMICAWLNVVSDISDIKSYREELYNERNLLSDLLETARIVICVTDKNARLVLLNPFLEKLCGLEGKQVEGRKWTAVLLDRAQVKKADAMLKNAVARADGCGEKFEFCLAGSKARKNIELHARAIKDSSGAVSGFLLVGQDVTEKESASRRLVELGKAGVELERIINASPAVAFIWESGKHRTIKFVSKNIRQFGFEADNLLSDRADYYAFVHPEDRRILIGDFESFKADCVGKFFRRLYRFKTASGKMRWVEERTWAELDENMCPVDFRAVVWDATQRISATERLDEFRKQLEQQKMSLSTKDAAIDEMFKHLEAEKQRVSEQIEQNIKSFVLPALQRLKTLTRKNNMPLVMQLENNFESVTGAFGINLANIQANLSAREAEICNMIRSGLSSKDIASVLGICTATATRHRNNIRQKLGIVGKQTSLASFLHTLD